MIADLLTGKSNEDIIRDLSKLSQNELDETLTKACINGKTSVIQYLIDASANVNIKNCHGYTPLIYASANGFKDIVQILIDNGADVNAKTINNITALSKASRNGLENAINILIDNEKNLNDRDKDDWAPLIIDSYKNHKDIVELLKKHGAKE